MHFERIFSAGVAHCSYFLSDGGDALVVDPRRDVGVYLALAREHGAQVRAILETHRNEDYVIGSTALADATGAPVLHSARMEFGYGTPVSHGDSVRAGRWALRVLETPGHTDESLSFAVADTSASGDPVMVLTGDALFIGDTGRTDLYGEAQEERLARALHRSLFETIFPLGDGVLLFPAHGGGSVCGGNIADRALSSLGYERIHNQRLRSDRDEFVRLKAAEQHVMPPYFRRMEEWNQRGNAPIHSRIPVLAPLSPGELAERMQGGVALIDTRMPQAFAGGHEPGSYNIWLEGLTQYLGWIVEPGTPIALVLPQDASVEGVTRALLRIGYDEMVGYLRGGFESWQNEGRPIGRHATIDTAALAPRVRRGEVTVLDVRKPGERAEGGIDGSMPIFVGELERRIAEVPRDRPIVTTCTVGHRGGLAASILARHGVDRVMNYLGGTTAWAAAAK